MWIGCLLAEHCVYIGLIFSNYREHSNCDKRLSTIIAGVLIPLIRLLCGLLT